jgi:signal transduction histidine kinase
LHAVGAEKIGMRTLNTQDLLSMELVLGDALSVPAVRFRDRIIECELAVEHDLLVRTEPAAWYQVISNLVANSALHGFADRPEGGCIAMSAVRLGTNRARVTYRDDGRGFSVSERAAAFRQRQPCDSRASGGTPGGLGLAIVHDIVKSRLRGTISLRDDDYGATFDIDFPTLVSPLS